MCMCVCGGEGCVSRHIVKLLNTIYHIYDILLHKYYILCMYISTYICRYPQAYFAIMTNLGGTVKKLCRTETLENSNMKVWKR